MSWRYPLVLRLAIAWLALLLMSLVLVPWLPLASPAATEPSESLRPPSSANWLGTDLLGRDVLSRLLWGARRTLGMALLAVLIVSAGGTTLGLVAGLSRSWDAWLMRAVEVALALPQLLIALVLVPAFGPGPWSVGTAAGLAGVAGFARLARSAAQQIRSQQYIRAAEALGATPRGIITRHVLPNIMPVLASVVAIHFAWAILNTSTLTFLGFGGSATTPDWGLMLNEGRAYLISAPWVSTAPGLAITLTVLAVNTLGAHWDQLSAPVSQRRVKSAS